MARLVLPSRLELKRPEGSSNEAPLAKVIFTTCLYVSPVQMMPACDHTGTPRHFHSSTTSGSAWWMSARTLARVSPRQSPRSLIRPSISRDGESFASAIVLIALPPGQPSPRAIHALLVRNVGPEHIFDDPLQLAKRVAALGHVSEALVAVHDAV